MDKIQFVLAGMTALFIVMTLICLLLNRENNRITETLKDLLAENIRVICKLKIVQSKLQKAEKK